MDKARLQVRFLTIVASILAITDISYSSFTVNITRTTAIPRTTPAKVNRTSVTVYTSCGGEVPTSVDTIKYPETGNYQKNLNCVWQIKRETRFNLVFINSFDLEAFGCGSCCDFVQINGGTKYCGYTLPPPYTANNGEARITFKSDSGGGGYRGFTIRITAECHPECQNGGRCTSTDRCTCIQGWTGDRCERATTTGVHLVCDGQEMTATFNTSYFPGDILNITVPYCAKEKYEVRNNNTLHCKFDKCAKRISESENVMTQENVVNVDVGSQDPQHVIERSVLYSYTLQCKFNRKVLVHTDVSVEVKRVTKEFAAEKYTNFSVNMEIYRTKEFVKAAKSPHIVASADDIYVQINSSNNNETLFQFVTTTCFATPGKDADNPKKYIFFDDRCKLDNTFQQLNSGSRNVFRFKIHSFTFIRLKKSIFFHCELLVCKKESSSPKCSQECGMSRRRRRAVESEDEEKMTVSSGEIHWHEANEVKMK